MSVLKDFQGNVLLENAHPDIVWAVQTELAEIGLYTLVIDGKPNQETLTAFKQFKFFEYLQHPEMLGKTTAKALLEATRPHPTPADKKFDTTIRYASLPRIGVVESGQRIAESQHFTWGELTHDLTRIPESTFVVEKLIALSRYLDEVRDYLGDRPITLTSGYRPIAINKAVGGVSSSRHILGDAADFVVSGLPPGEVYKRLDTWHGNRGGLGNSKHFTHLDLRGYRARFAYG